jgi:hypothetical protein
MILGSNDYNEISLIVNKNYEDPFRDGIDLGAVLNQLIDYTANRINFF